MLQTYHKTHKFCIIWKFLKCALFYTLLRILLALFYCSPGLLTVKFVEFSVAYLLYSAVLKSQMKICQKYGKNIEVKHKTEERKRKKRGLCQEKRNRYIEKYGKENLGRFWRLAVKLPGVNCCCC